MVRAGRLRIVESGQTCGIAYSAAMPKLIFTCAVLALLFCLLCGPVLYVALRFRRGGDAAALRPLRTVWLAQLALASVLIFVADSIGLLNPIGAMLAIVFAVSLGGAALFGLWRLVVR
jgi:hypothetical protein